MLKPEQYISLIRDNCDGEEDMEAIVVACFRGPTIIRLADNRPCLILPEDEYQQFTDMWPDIERGLYGSS